MGAGPGAHPDAQTPPTARPLTFLSPTQETPGEDPLLTARYAAAFVQGLQGPDPRAPRLAATCKHFDAYSFEGAGGVPRTAFNAVVAPDDLQDTYFPAFEVRRRPLPQTPLTACAGLRAPRRRALRHVRVLGAQRRSWLRQ